MDIGSKWRALKKLVLASALLTVPFLPFSQPEEIKTVVATTVSPYNFMSSPLSAKINAVDSSSSLSVDATLGSAEYLSPPPVRTISYKGLSSGGSDLNPDELWIYMVESGNNPARTNSEGCIGIGQACPASKLLAVCPSLDYSCEERFFTQYMLSRYHSWANARSFHEARGWW